LPPGGPVRGQRRRSWLSCLFRLAGRAGVRGSLGCRACPGTSTGVRSAKESSSLPNGPEASPPAQSGALRVLTHGHPRAGQAATPGRTPCRPGPISGLPWPHPWRPAQTICWPMSSRSAPRGPCQPQSITHGHESHRPRPRSPTATVTVPAASWVPTGERRDWSSCTDGAGPPPVRVVRSRCGQGASACDSPATPSVP
jgi:hypothetical protein